MWQDPIVEEIHKIREALVAQFQYDVQALGKFFQAQQAAEHREVVTRAPRRAPEGAQPTRVVRTEPNKGLELTASSVRSCLAPASGSSSGLAFGALLSGLGYRSG